MPADVSAAEQEQSRDDAAGAREERGINRQGIKYGSNAQLRKGALSLSLSAVGDLGPSPRCIIAYPSLPRVQFNRPFSLLESVLGPVPCHVRI